MMTARLLGRAYRPRRRRAKEMIDMSWSIEVTGTKAAVAGRVAEQLDKIAASYAGKPEGDDVAAVKARLLAQIEACDLSSGFNAVVVKANGSHCVTNAGLVSASFQASVTRASLAL